MRSSLWKSLLTQKGWWDAERHRFAPPADAEIFLTFAHQGNGVYKKLSNVIEGTDDFIVFQQHKALEYLLWEDICEISVYTK